MCGIIGIVESAKRAENVVVEQGLTITRVYEPIDKPGLIEKILIGLQELYKRGHQGTGISFALDKHNIERLVSYLEPRDFLNGESAAEIEERIDPSLETLTSLGHVRYRTSGGEKESRQPMIGKGGEYTDTEDQIKDSQFALVHNGTIFGRKDLEDTLDGRGVEIEDRDDYSDTQLTAEIIASSKKRSFEEKLIETIDLITPTSALAIQYRGKLYAYLDPTGNRPLKVGKLDNGWAVASEEPALRKIGIEKENIKNMTPGELVVLEPGKKKSIKLYEPWRHRCLFEDIYLSQARIEFEDAKLWEEQPISEQRISAGKKLWEYLAPRDQERNILRTLGAYLDPRNSEKSILRTLRRCLNPQESIAAYVPNSAYWSATGLSEASGIPFIKKAIKADEKRTFILDQPDIDQAVKEKYGIDEEGREHLYGKRVYMTDDLIVRGKTMWNLVKKIRLEGGVDELHIGIASSSIISPCKYGMNFQTYAQLLAHHLDEEQIETYFRARFMGYDNSEDQLMGLIKEEEENGKPKYDLNFILKNCKKNYLRDSKENREQAFNPRDRNPERFSLKYLSSEDMIESYGIDPDKYCTACFTDKHWEQEWYKKKDELRIKDTDRRWAINMAA